MVLNLQPVKDTCQYSHFIVHMCRGLSMTHGDLELTLKNDQSPYNNEYLFVLKHFWHRKIEIEIHTYYAFTQLWQL